MKNKLFHKVASGLATLSLLLNSLIAPLSVYSQEETPTPEVTQIEETTPSPEESPSPAPEETPTPEPSLEPEPTVEVVPTPSEEVSETPEEVLNEESVDVTPTETLAPEETPASEENPSQGDEQVQAESTESQLSPTPEAVPAEPEEGTLAVVVMENTLASTLPDFSFDITELGTVSLTTDKPDYAPTDSVLIFGNGFTPSETYNLVISSENEPPVSHEDQITANENGAFTYTYQLDGNYRPDYLVEAFDLNGTIIATVTFTDTDTTTLFPSGQGFYTQWNGDEGDVDETGSVSCGSSDGSDNIASNNNGNRESVNIGLSSVPDGSTITSVQVFVWDVASGTIGGTYQTFVRVGSTNTDSGVNLATTSSSGCTARNQTINIPDFVKSGSTDLEVGVLKIGNTNVRVGAIRAVVTYTAAPQPDLVVTKTNNVGGNAIINTPFTWTLTATNNGSGSAVFANNEDVLQDNLPDSNDFDYSPTSNISVLTSGGVTGGFDCDIDNGDDLDCDADGTLTIPAGGSFSLSITSTPTSTGTFNNPRSGGSNKCQVDPDGLESESNEGNNNCSDSVTVSYNVADNPDLPQSCVGTIVLVLDSSDSMSDGDITTVKNSANSFVDSLLPGTPTQIGVIDFDTTVISSLAPTSNKTDVLNAINSIGHTGATEYTNWEAALTTANGMVGSGALILIITDGNPTESDGPLSDLSDAIVAANLIKSSGTRILAIGIDSSGTSGGLNLASLEAITGTNDIVVPPGTITDINAVDVVTGDISSLGSVLADLVRALCGGTITVTKLIDADGNVDSTDDQTPASDWSFDIGGTSSVTDQNGLTEAVTLSAGTYAVSETPQEGYSLLDASCTGALNNGTFAGEGITGIEIDNTSIVSCTFINSQMGNIVVDKVTDPSGDTTSFTFDPSWTEDFGLTDEDNPYDSGPIPTGTYSLSEIVPEGWEQTNATCSDQSDPSLIDLQAGETVTCTFTNTKLGLITIAKVTDPAEDPENFTFEGVLSGQITDGGTLTSQYLLPGEYSETEIVPSGWDLTSISCSDDSQGSLENATATINLQAGEELTCTFTNTKRGHLVVEKVTLPEGDQTEFEILAEGDGTITDGGEGTVSTGASRDYEVTPGAYSVTETPLEGWDETGNTCGEVEVGAGETVNCQIENTKRGQVTVTKYHDRNANGIQDEGEEELSEWEIDLSGDTGITDEDGQIIFENLVTGEYVLSETIDEGWYQSNISCGESGEIDNDNEYPIFISPGDEIACNIGNYQNGSISGAKWNDENANQKNDEEPVLSGWTIFIDENGNGQLDGEEASQATGEDGSYLLEELTPGTYRVCEVLQAGWLQTYPLNSELNDCHDVVVSSGDEIQAVDFGNQQVILGLSIEKSNDKATANAGDVVTFTLLIQNNSNQQTQNLSIIDVLPAPFTYVSGSSQVNSVAWPDPTIASGVMTWDIGTLNQGVNLTITYQAQIASDTTVGTYENLAFCKGEGFSLLRVRLLGDVECDPSASSSVRITSGTNFGGSVGGAVLGAATELPASGSDTSIVVYALVALWLGTILKLGGYILNMESFKKGKIHGKK